MNAYGATAYSYAKSSEAYGISAARPYVESDTASRTAALWEGVAGVITSAGDAYARIKYNSVPTYSGMDTRAPRLRPGFNENGEPVPPTGQPMQIWKPGIYVAVAAVALIIILMIGKRR